MADISIGMAMRFHAEKPRCWFDLDHESDRLATSVATVPHALLGEVKRCVCDECGGKIAAAGHRVVTVPAPDPTP